MEDSEEVREIRVGEGDFGDVEELWLPVVQLRKEKKRMLKKLAQLEASEISAQGRFWIEMEERYPELEDGGWLWIHNEHRFEEKPKNDDGIPPFLKKLLGGEL